MNTENKPNIREVEVSYSYDIKPSLLPKITCSKEVYLLFLQTWDLGKIGFVEQCKLMLLNRANRVLGIVDISTGGHTGTVVDAKVLFACALKCNATSIALAHNHPSGNLDPSESDRKLTEQLRQVGKLLTLPVLDHLIITPEDYYSFADAGIL